MVALAKAGGRLKLCGLHPDVTAAVKVTGLDRVLDICDETSALAGVWRPSWGAEWKAFSAAAVAPCLRKSHPFAGCFAIATFPYFGWY